MKRNTFHILLVLAGLAAMLAGLFWARAMPDAVPAYLCLGLGAGGRWATAPARCCSAPP